MIDGLMLTISGEELRRLLDERKAAHRRSADRWRHEQTRTPESQTEDAPLLPTGMCEHEEERHLWRAEVLEFICDHLESAETYRLGAADLEFGELLPVKPAAVEQDEYEERTAVGFHLGRLAKRLGELRCRASAATDDWVPPGFKATRVDVTVGLETFQIDQIEPADKPE